MVGEVEEGLLGGLADVGDPFGRDAIAEEFAFRKVLEEGGSLRGLGTFGGGLGFDVFGDEDFFDAFADFDDLGGTGGGVGFDFAAFGPLVGFVVVVDVAEEEAAFGAMDDEADVAADTGAPEVFVFGFVEFVELDAGVGGVGLEVEDGDLDQLLLVAGEAGEAGGEGISDAEVHA